MKTYGRFGRALTLAAITVAAVAPVLADEVQVKVWAAACASCHGTNGNATGAAVRLAGAPQADTLGKLLAFKKGERPATIMHQISKGYSDEQLAAIAAYFANQR